MQGVRFVSRLAAAGLMLALASTAAAQSQATNATIEGIVRDSSGGVLPGVTVTIANLETGAERVVFANESGLYRAPLLPLGTYRVTAELDGFKKFEQRGITLAAGQAAVLDITLEVGSLTEVVSVTADTPIVDTAKIDLGRNLDEREVKNLPLVSRNPYNFALLQPGVTGFENSEFGVPRLAANGTLMRINYQIDGNTNTQKDRAGLRLLPVSEVMVREVKVVTSGYAPEFGQTTGLVYNAITPSGTNQIHGSASYRFRRKSFSAFPFFFQGPRTDERKPDTKVDTWTAEVGGPVVRDRLHYFFGFERTFRDLSAQRVITANPAAVAQLGLPAQPGVIPAEQTARFFIGKADYQLAPAHRLTGRYIRFANDSPHNIGATSGGVPTTLEWSTDFLDAMNSAAAQLVSTFGANKLNELRLQFANRHQSRTSNDSSGTGPAVRVQGVANFGGPIASASDAGFDFKQNIWQVVNNFTYLRSNHSYKFGFDAQFVDDDRTSALFEFYTFPSIDAYLSARNGINPRSYSTFTQLIGNPAFDMSSRLYSFFVQDDWRIAPDFKILYGVRYDLYDYPEADPSSPFDFSRDFNIDKNNWGPRVGVAWTVGPEKRTVVRASTGIMYDQPLLAAYENAIQQNGLPARVTVTLSGTSAGAPAFPSTLADRPAGFVLPTQSIFAVDPEFQVARTIQNNIQIERSIGTDYSVSAGLVYAKGYDLPVVNNINLINPVRTLEDGRPVFSTAVNASTRMDPRFNQINVVESVGESTYTALSLQVARRLSRGIQFDLTYTLGKGEDNAPLIGDLAVNGDDPRSDPTNLDRDKGPNLLDTRHNFAGSIVASSDVESSNPLVRALLSDHQVGLLLQFNSGLPFNVRAGRDLNLDGVSTNDRPLFVGRNSVYLPARWNVDLRYSRFLSFGVARRAEVMAEFKNLLNTVQTASVSRVLAVDVNGSPLAPIPADGDGFIPTGGYEQRQFQLGFKFHF